MRPLIIDVEASGFGAGSYPIEVGVVFPNGKSYCALIRPQPEWVHWDNEAENLHGISRSTLKQYGKNAAAVAKDLNTLLAGELVYSDAWGNDSSWLALLFDSAEISQHFRLESLRSLISNEQLKVWNQTKTQVEAEYRVERHRASNDALILQQTFYVSVQCADKAGSGSAQQPLPT